MAINNDYTKLALAMSHLKNPNKQTGTMLIEFPADIGRAYSGYKRGGIIEGAEKFRKEVMSAIVWLFGIPVFNKLGNFACEKLLKIPMDIDYSNAKDGRDAILDSVKYLAKGENPNGLDVSELKKYVGKFKIEDVDKTVLKIKHSKQAISIAAWALNCILMGIVLPKINQKITAKKLKEQEKVKQVQTGKFISFDEFKEKNSSKNISFKGGIGTKIAGMADSFTYGINSNNKYRLISTDGPMILGRCLSARNKFEALEIALMDGSAIYFYNYCTKHCEDLFRKIFKTPSVSSTVAEMVTGMDNKDIFNKLEGAKKLKDLFKEEDIKAIYKEATNGQYGKINRFVKNSELEEIDKSVIGLLEYLKKNSILTQDGIDKEKAMSLVRSINKKSAVFYSIGTILSVVGLGILIPKVVYGIIKKITGKDGFVGIEDDKKKDVKNC